MGCFSTTGAEPNAFHINDGKLYTKNDLLNQYRQTYAGVARQEINIGSPTVNILNNDLVLVTSPGPLYLDVKKRLQYFRGCGLDLPLAARSRHLDTASCPSVVRGSYRAGGELGMFLCSLFLRSLSPDYRDTVYLWDLVLAIWYFAGTSYTDS